MTELVLDASVVVKWFRDQNESNVEQARELRTMFEEGNIFAFAPPLLAIEVLNAAGRRWGWNGEQLDRLANALLRLGFELRLPDLDAVARWTAAGLTAYDATYVAVAERTGATLVTADREILDLAPALSIDLTKAITVLGVEGA